MKNKYFSIAMLGLKMVTYFILILISSCVSSHEPTSTSSVIEKPPTSDGVEIKVLSYNVHHCNPPGKPGFIDVEKIAEIIRDSKAELVGLQEIDVNNYRSGKHLDQAKKLANLTDMYFYFSKGIEYRGGSFGTAILSKFPISEMETLALPEETGTEMRTLSIVTVALPNAFKLRFGNTHLDYTSDANALVQAKAITKYIDEEDLPVILVGDFNVEAKSQTMAHLDNTFERTCEQGCPKTFPVGKANKTIDFIMYTKGFGIRTMTHEVVQEHFASDHLPVWAKLKFKP